MSSSDNSNPNPSSQRTAQTPSENDLWDLNESYNTSDTTVTPLSKNLDAPVDESLTEQPTQEALAEVGDPLANNQAATKPKLTIIEKLALSSLALMLLSGGLLGYIWIHSKNKLAEISYTIDLPTKGEYATITDFSTHWMPASDFDNVDKQSILVPVVNITLGKESTSGVLRFYFYSDEKNIIGDPVGISFKEGLFSNGERHIEVNATAGFENENQYTQYQLETQINWQIEILEAANRNVKGSDFKLLANTNIASTRILPDE